VRRNRLLVLVFSLITLFAFTASCMAATATTTKKPAPAKKVVKKAPVKKPAVKPAATPAKPAAPAAVKPAVPAAGAAAAGAAAGAAATKPAEPAAPANPAGFTGDKAKAYDMLTKVKYSGKAEGKFKADLKKIIIIGDKVMFVDTKSTGSKTLAASKDVPGLAGGDFKDKEMPKVPFIELVAGDAKAIETILKQAKDVKIAGNVITIIGAEPPDSILAILNSVSSKVKWTKSRLEMSTVEVKVGTAAVEAVSNCTIKGVAEGTNDMPATVTGNVTY